LIDDVLLLLRQGGWVMAPIVIVSIVAWALLIYEWLALRDATGIGKESVDRAVVRLERGELTSLRAGSGEPARENSHVVLSVLRSGIVEAGLDRESFEAQVAPLMRSETALRWRSLRLVAMLAVTMPLLGLLGTVLGMTQTFGAFTTRGAPEINTLADGISQALITTQAGLVATVPVLLAHGVLGARVRQYLGFAEITLKKIEALICSDG
jgi:biopolymer transport protein ExbB